MAPRTYHFTRLLLQYSTATPFRIKQNKISCIFHCGVNIAHNSVSLRDHNIKHEKHLAEAYTLTPKSVLRLDITNLSCKLCDHLLETFDNFEQHISSKHGKIPMKNSCDIPVPYKLDTSQCQVCGLSLKDFEALNNHLETHFCVEVCATCGMQFMDTKKLYLHQRREHQEKKFSCEECGVKFATRGFLNRHVQTTHQGTGQNKCSMCPGLRFKEYHYKKKHMVEVHGVAVKKFKCEICTETRATSSMMRLHMGRDHGIGDLNFKCCTCNKAFLTRGALERHDLRIHVQLKLRCWYCDNLYNCLKTLSKHINRLHADRERKYLCSYCGFPSENRSILSQHIRSEHGDKNYNKRKGDLVPVRNIN